MGFMHATNKQAIAKPPPPRRDKRISQRPLTVRVDDVIHIADDWSFGGFMLVLPQPQFRAGQLLTGELVRGPGQSYRFAAAVARCDTETGRVALRFIELSEPCFKLLEDLQRGAVGGGIAA